MASVVASSAAALASRVLAVFIVFFGELPPWLPLTLHSMASNPRVSFIIIGDCGTQGPPTVVPPNVVFERISWEAMQIRLSELLTPGNSSSVRHTFHYKANDYKPLAPYLYPERLLIPGTRQAHEWWAWADLDVVFGDLLKFSDRALTRPACCKVPLNRHGKPKKASAVNVYLHKQACACEHGEQVNVITPLYPNPWTKKAWGPYTAFRVDFGKHLFEHSAQWREVVAASEYAHFDEWWGPFKYSKGWETMGDVVTRLAEETGSAILSKLKMPFAEAKTCRDGSCMFCPCGALRLRLSKGKLAVNEREVMLLHLAESKFSWTSASRAGRVALPPWSPSAPFWAADGCVEVSGMGWLNGSCGSACSSRAPLWLQADEPGAEETATRLGRHRVIGTWAGHIKYATQEADVRLRAGGCSAAMRALRIIEY